MRPLAGREEAADEGGPERDELEDRAGAGDVEAAERASEGVDEGEDRRDGERRDEEPLLAPPEERCRPSLLRRRRLLRAVVGEDPPGLVEGRLGDDLSADLRVGRLGGRPPEGLGLRVDGDDVQAPLLHRRDVPLLRGPGLGAEARARLGGGRADRLLVLRARSCPRCSC